jgi:hypothetical protein
MGTGWNRSLPGAAQARVTYERPSWGEEILGFDVPSQLQPDLVVLATNLRDSRLNTLDYGAVWHGCVLGASALLLEGRYGQVLLSCSHNYRNAFPWGSHMTLGPLMSTGATRFVHYGARFTRFEKTWRGQRAAGVSPAAC